MADTMAMTIHLSPETREYIRKKVEGGEYASESDVIAESIDMLRDEDDELRRSVVAAHNELMADPSSGVTVEQLRAELEAWRCERLKAS